MPQIDSLTDRYLQFYYAQFPDEATDAGFPGFDTELPDFSPERVNATHKAVRSIAREAGQASPQDPSERIDADLLVRRCERTLYQLHAERHHVCDPQLYVDTASNSLFSLIMATHVSDSEKTQALSARLQKIPRFFAQAKENLNEPVALWTELAQKEAQGFATFLKDVVLPFLQKNAANGAQNLSQAATAAAFDFSHFLSQLKKLRADFHIGQEGFEHLLKRFHGLEHTAAGLREIGFAQIDELNAELNAQAKKIDADKSWQELIAELKENHPREENLLQAYREKVAEIKAFLKDKDVVTIPREETLAIIETPAFLLESIPFAAYRHPRMFAADPQGLFFVTPPRGNEEVLKDHCLASFPLTALHEAYPGHHLQFSRQRQSPVKIRKVYDVASYYEGWTLYCEEMMYRLGFYDETMRLYQLKDRLWRACRIVVDVGMQCFGMTDAQAAQFLVDNAKLSKQGARVDVNWYTRAPTIPMSYLIGMLEVDRLRQDFMRRGKSLKEFHDAFLSTGAIPLRHVRAILGLS